jgi:type VI secretion system protein ImpA
LDADDDNDPTMRINALALAGTKASPSPMMRYLRSTPLTQSRTFGRLNLLNIQQGYGEVVLAEGQNAEYDRTSVNAAFTDTSPEILKTTLTAAKQVLADLKAIDKIVGQKASGVDFSIDDLIKMAQVIVRHVGDHVAGDPPAAEAAADADGDGDSGGGAPALAAPRKAGGGGGLSGAVETAADARAALDRVIDYFKRYEPSSPVPIILERAKRLVGADFMKIMKDMAPQGLENVRMIGGLSDDDD